MAFGPQGAQGDLGGGQADNAQDLSQVFGVKRAIPGHAWTRYWTFLEYILARRRLQRTRG